MRGWVAIVVLVLFAAIGANCTAYSGADCAIECDGGAASEKGFRIVDALPVAEGMLAGDGAVTVAQAIFEVKLDAVAATEVRVDFATFDSAAKAGEDYVAKSGTLVFPPGSDTQTIKVDIIDDAAPEPTESFTIRLANAIGAPLVRSEATGSILDDDGAGSGPQLTIASAAAQEGNAGSTSFDFVVTLSAVSVTDVTVDYQTTDGTATSTSGDYVTTAGQLTIPAGETQGTISITINGDTLNEPNETFSVTLSNPSNARLGTSAMATGTIQNDDSLPTISIGDVSSTEGNTGNKAFTLPVTLSAPSALTVTVAYGTADGTATAGSADYASASGTLTFNPGVTTQNVIVNVAGDNTDEGTETFAVNLSSPSNATILDGTGIATILNDDGALPTLSINNSTATEGSSIGFTVTLSAASASTVTVTYATGAGSAPSPSDFTSSSGTLSFSPGQTSKTITITTANDTLYEGDETFTVDLSGATNANIAAAQGTGTIVDNDVKPSLAIANVSLNEGTGGANKTSFAFAVTLSGAAGVSVTVNYATADGTATSANDYVAVSGVLTFPAGATSATITVQVNKDATNEANETFFVNLSGATNATIADSQAVGTIQNDD